jgi:hypothetical protein
VDLGDALYVLATVAGMVLAYLAGRHARSRTQQMLCPCGHAVSFHEDLTGRCHAKLRRRDISPGPVSYVPCDCQVYAGPELVRVWGRPMLPGPE